MRACSIRRASAKTKPGDGTTRGRRPTSSGARVRMRITELVVGLAQHLTVLERGLAQHLTVLERGLAQHLTVLERRRSGLLRGGAIALGVIGLSFAAEVASAQEEPPVPPASELVLERIGR